MKKQPICAVLAALLLTACSSEPLINTDAEPDITAQSGTAEGAGSVTTTQLTSQTLSTEPFIPMTVETAVTTTITSEVPADESPNFVIVPAPAVTYTTPAATKPAVTTEAQPDYNLRFTLPMNIGDLFLLQGGEKLAGTGIVHAKDGLRLRDKPSTKSKQLTTLKDGETVEILGVEPAQDSVDERYHNEPGIYSDNRWYHIRAGGQEGYAGAKYIAAAFSQKPSELTRRQLRAMTAYLYCQAQDLYIVFARDGGFKGRGQNSADHFSNDQGLYEAVQPSSVKLNGIYDEFYQYFSKNYHKDELNPKSKDKAQYYAEKNGKLYVNTSFGDNVWFYKGYPLKIKSMTDTEVKCTAVFDYTPEYIVGNKSSEVTDFSLVYEDGVWKIGTFSPVY